MSLTSQTLHTNPNFRLSYFTNTRIFPLKNPSLYLKNPPHFQILRHTSPNPNSLISFRSHQFRLRAFGSIQSDSNGINKLNFDTFLSVAEFMCLFSSAVVSIGFAVNCVVSGSQKAFTGWLGNTVLAWQIVVLVGGLVIGAWIRRRQWMRICKAEANGGGEFVNLVGRIEKLEEDLRSSATIIRVLSRQLEKLGIRFRVTRKALKEPIAETATLAQKNSEATRALAVQEDILEKELGEIQKVLLLMQEQQQKQLELILAIGKTGKLWESRRVPSQEQDAIETYNSAEGLKQIEAYQGQAVSRNKGTNNDKA